MFNKTNIQTENNKCYVLSLQISDGRTEELVDRMWKINWDAFPTWETWLQRMETNGVAVHTFNKGGGLPEHMFLQQVMENVASVLLVSLNGEKTADRVHAKNMFDMLSALKIKAPVYCAYSTSVNKLPSNANVAECRDPTKENILDLLAEACRVANGKAVMVMVEGCIGEFPKETLDELEYEGTNKYLQCMNGGILSEDDLLDVILHTECSMIFVSESWKIDLVPDPEEVQVRSFPLARLHAKYDRSVREETVVKRMKMKLNSVMLIFHMIADVISTCSSAAVSYLSSVLIFAGFLKSPLMMNSVIQPPRSEHWELVPVDDDDKQEFWKDFLSLSWIPRLNVIGTLFIVFVLQIVLFVVGGPIIGSIFDVIPFDFDFFARVLRVLQLTNLYEGYMNCLMDTFKTFQAAMITCVRCWISPICGIGGFFFSLLQRCYAANSTKLHLFLLAVNTVQFVFIMHFQTVIAGAFAGHPMIAVGLGFMGIATNYLLSVLQMGFALSEAAKSYFGSINRMSCLLGSLSTMMGIFEMMPETLAVLAHGALDVNATFASGGKLAYVGSSNCVFEKEGSTNVSMFLYDQDVILGKMPGDPDIVCGYQTFLGIVNNQSQHGNPLVSLEIDNNVIHVKDMSIARSMLNASSLFFEQFGGAQGLSATIPERVTRIEVQSAEFVFDTVLNVLISFLGVNVGYFATIVFVGAILAFCAYKACSRLTRMLAVPRFAEGVVKPRIKARAAGEKVFLWNDIILGSVLVCIAVGSHFYPVLCTHVAFFVMAFIIIRVSWVLDHSVVVALPRQPRVLGKTSSALDPAVVSMVASKASVKSTITRSKPRKLGVSRPVIESEITGYKFFNGLAFLFKYILGFVAVAFAITVYLFPNTVFALFLLTVYVLFLHLVPAKKSNGILGRVSMTIVCVVQTILGAMVCVFLLLSFHEILHFVDPSAMMRAEAFIGSLPILWKEAVGPIVLQVDAWVYAGIAMCEEAAKAAWEQTNAWIDVGKGWIAQNF